MLGSVTETKNLVDFGLTHCWSSDDVCLIGADENLFSTILEAFKVRPLKRMEFQGNDTSEIFLMYLLLRDES